MKKHLNDVSYEQFQKECNEIVDFNLGGLTIDEYLLFLKHNKLKQPISRKRKLIYIYNKYKNIKKFGL
jgi:hypothetical protein